MSAEPLSGGGPVARPARSTARPTRRPSPRRLTPVRAVPAPPTTPFVRPGRHAAPEGGAAKVTSTARDAANDALAPETDAARRVRETWEAVEPEVDELADWFAALLFSLAPTTRALFPAQVTGPARRLLRSLVIPMSTVDRPAELRAMIAPLVREHRALGLDAEQY
ncbi:MAG: hypothetical protein AVDCRST_MAG54-2994 [uncultured Actinomycetospora sp.]|uniref:Globin domain-containing protein n=1 Tax=uncultured Actinomycetospora sp. TaxID=1135996 RepID=A0A6J4J8N3_9PSEU|nr:MAG: hypothetical protein AVDCRST_MAG54-2994 [uncultured Actinomycetospora sp.]